MNLAAMKYNKIINVSGNFYGSTKTIQEDIIAILAHRASSIRKPTPTLKDNDDSPPTTKFKHDSPPFLIHYQTSEKIKYKDGDKKDHAGTTFYF